MLEMLIYTFDEQRGKQGLVEFYTFLYQSHSV